MRIATLYTGPEHDWAALEAISGLDRSGLVELNPHLDAVEVLEAGIPVDIPQAKRMELLRSQLTYVDAPSAYAVARRELLMDVAEDPRPGKDNSRIRLYHSTTVGGAEPDEVSWCSSFVNYCVEQSGERGTDSKAARSWVKWGRAVDRGDWREGDIVGFWGEAPKSWTGDVGVLASLDDPRPQVLGGNEANRLSIAAPYPFDLIIGLGRAV